MNQTTPNNEYEESKKKRRWLLALLLLLFFIIALFFLYWLGYIRSPQDNGAVISGNVLPALGNATEREILDEMQRIADSSKFSFKVNSNPVFRSGNSTGNLYIENPGNNAYAMAVTVYLNDTDELIYESGGILPNHYINHGKLTRNLSAGTYHATADLNAYDLDTKLYKGKTTVAMIITVKE